MVKLIPKLILITATIVLSACSVFSPVATPNTTYLINTLPDNLPQGREQIGSLMVAAPSSVPVYNTTDMAYTTSAYQIAYFAKSTWAETPAQMLKPLLVQSLTQTHHFHVVTSSEVAGQSDYVLHTQILELRQIFTAGSSAVHFRLAAEMVNTSTGKVIAAKLFTVVTPATENTPYGGVAAANAATAEMLSEVSHFVIHKL